MALFRTELCCGASWSSEVGAAAAAWEPVLACTASHPLFVTALGFIVSFLIFVLH